MKKFWKRNWTSIVLSLVVGTVILAVDITSRPYAAFGGGLLFIAIVAYWIVRMEGENMKIKNLFRRKPKPAQKNRPTPVGANQLNQINNNTKRMVLSMLTTYPQSRYLLASAIGVSERTVRAAIRQLRLEGEPIISVSSVQGYRLGTAEEAKRTAKELRGRAYNLLNTAKALEGIDDNQLTLEEVMNL